VDDEGRSGSFDAPIRWELFQISQQAWGEEFSGAGFVRALQEVALGKLRVGIEVDVIVNDGVANGVQKRFSGRSAKGGNGWPCEKAATVWLTELFPIG
jgi:hypothetical protein